MSQRITELNLENVIERINQLTHSPSTSCTKNKDGVYIFNVGNYHLAGAYGGWSLHRIQNEGGGVTDVLQLGYVSKKELYYAMQSFIRGIESAHNKE